MPPAKKSAPQNSEQAHSYQGLARKWRPATFEDLVGQSTVADGIAASIRENKISHAHLFSGPRGVGKTTSARILARAINCEKGPTATPCGKCRHCLDIATGNDLDVIEIDAASNTKVEEMRDLLERVLIAPFSARYKVYIIDEVHMLSNSSFNALLKTLEEPPPRVVFILATTETEKVPETVRSRCIQHKFERLSVEQMIARLRHVAEGEGVKLPEDEAREVYGLIARAVEGGMRDALVALDQLLALTEGQPTTEAAERLLGLASQSALRETAQALADGDGGRLVSIIEELVSKGRSLERFIKGLMAYLHDIMLLQANAPKELLSISGEASIAQAHELAKRLKRAQVFNILNQLFEIEERLKRTPQARLLVEFSFLRMAVIKPVVPIDELITRIRALPEERAPQPVIARIEPVPAKRMQPAAVAYAFSDSEPSPCVAEPSVPFLKSPAKTAQPLAGLSRDELIEMIVPQLSDARRFLGRYLRLSLTMRVEESTLWIQWPKGERMGSTFFTQPENRGEIERVMTQICQRPMTVKTSYSEEAAAEPPPAPPRPAARSLALRDSGGEEEIPSSDFLAEELSAVPSLPIAVAGATGEHAPELSETAARRLFETNSDFGQRARMARDFLAGAFVDGSGRTLTI